MTEATKTMIRPLGDRVLLKRLEADNNVQGGIILPDSAKVKQETAEVVAMGPGIKDTEGNLIPMPVAVGDKILMEKYSSQELTLDGEEYIILRAGDIIAIVE